MFRWRLNCCYLTQMIHRYSKYWSKYQLSPIAGIHEPPGPRTDRSDLVLDFLNFFGPGPVRSEIFQILLVLVRFGPRFSKFCWSWSGSVRDFQNFAGPGPVRSQIFQILLVLVRFGPRFSDYLLKSHPFWIQNCAFSWNRIRCKCGIGPNFSYLLKPHPFQMLIWVTIQIFTETASVSNVKKVKIRLFSETAKSISNTELGQNQAFSETASVTNAELGQNWAIFLNRIHLKCGLGSKSGFLLKPHPL